MTSAARRFPPGRLVDIGSHRLHVHCAGAGSPAVVFDAALAGSSLSWTMVQPQVAAVTRACAYDRAGLGWSDNGPTPRTAGRSADELFELLRRAEVAPPWVLVGHSFGAFVVQLLAARHPDAAAALVLLEPAHPADWLEPDEAQRRRIQRGAALCRYGAAATRFGLGSVVSALVRAKALTAARAMVGAISRGQLAREDEGILAPAGRLPPDVRAVLSRLWTQPKFFEALGSQIETIADSAREAAREPPDYDRLPLVVITGSEASAARLRLDADLARRARRGTHVVAPGSGHWVPLDAPDVVAAAISDLVGDLRMPLPR